MNMVTTQYYFFT